MEMTFCRGAHRPQVAPLRKKGSFGEPRETIEKVSLR